MKAVMMSIQPEWCEKIASGKKTIEIRKNKPKLKTPFKVYIYCTTDRGKSFLTKSHCTNELYTTKKRWIAALEKRGNVTYSGKVICEFVCDFITNLSIKYSNPDCKAAHKIFPFTGLTDKQIMDYLGNGKDGYGWHISDLVIYDKPKELSEFVSFCPEYEKQNFTAKCHDCEWFVENREALCYECACEGEKRLRRPPQSWCYVEVSNEV